MDLIKQRCDDNPINRPPATLIDEIMVYSAKIVLLGEYSKEFVSENFEFYQQLMKWQKEELTQCNNAKKQLKTAVLASTAKNVVDENSKKKYLNLILE